MTSESSRRTLAYYEANAARFWEGTRTHDVSQNIAALLSAVSGEGGRGPFSILDFGCGPGRDLLTFKEMGHTAVGFEGCAEFARMARAYSGCEVWERDFLAPSLGLPGSFFDGVFANASLFHVPGEHLPRVLRELRDALTPRGVLFCSNPRGEDIEGMAGERYACYFDYPRWHAIFESCGFEEIAHYYRPSDKPRAEQPWLAMLHRRRRT